MRRAESPTIQRFLADHYSLPDHEDIMSTHPFGLSEFDCYALRYGMKHCKEADVKRTQGSLQKLLLMFFLDECGASSPLDLWLRPGCRFHDLGQKLGLVLHDLRKGAVAKPEKNLQCAFLIACYYDFPEIISQSLRSPLPTEIVAKGFILGEKSGTQRCHC